MTLSYVHLEFHSNPDLVLTNKPKDQVCTPKLASDTFGEKITLLLIGAVLLLGGDGGRLRAP